jgi:N utilization substance protein A
MDKEIEVIIAREAGYGVEDESGLSTDDLIDRENAESVSDAYSDADAREEMIEFESDAVDTLVNDSQDASSEGIDNDGWDHDRE